MESTYDALKARYLKETGMEGMSLSVLTIGFGFILCAILGLGFGLLVSGICMAIDGFNTRRQGFRMEAALDSSASHRLAGHTDRWGDGMYPPQAYTPTNKERRLYNDEPSKLMKFGDAFFKWWTILWAPALITLFLISNI